MPKETDKAPADERRVRPYDARRRAPRLRGISGRTAVADRRGGKETDAKGHVRMRSRRKTLETQVGCTHSRYYAENSKPTSQVARMGIAKTTEIAHLHTMGGDIIKKRGSRRVQDMDENGGDEDHPMEVDEARQSVEKRDSASRSAWSQAQHTTDLNGYNADTESSTSEDNAAIEHLQYSLETLGMTDGPAIWTP
ncbi:hypothetical protein NEOLEDRAFT_745125 [Neolentinus lepideus HHB14362 ss-1]|uniref:Uncharacterized protein n=1 Tax=Neolentinus lepideus HHB14362 ss-1 TaxID=1314782 RepID=A0A165PSX7_9AGAM|nr:hypothetical protein NEOLEDRAFT_745125 [Neolentinus lepideus HHB14362 ss-1]